MPNALPIAGGARPSLPRPSTPSVLPSMSVPSVTCQGSPAFMRAFSQPIRRVSSSIRPKAMPVVGLPAAGAADRDAALGGGLDVDRGVAAAGGDQELEVGQCLDDGARKPRALAHHHDDLEVLAVADGVGVGAPHRVGVHLDLDVLELRPVGELERHVLVVVENRAAKGHCITPGIKPGGVCRAARACTRGPGRVLINQGSVFSRTRAFARQSA